MSQIATFSDEELAKAVIEMNNEEIRNLKRVNELIITMNELNEAKFNELYERFVSTLGFEKTITEVIYPYLEKVGILWLSGEVQAVQEHLISSLIRTKILKEIDDLPFPKDPKNSAIIFLPEGEYHELAILYFYYKLKKQGTLVYYFGQSTPVAQVVQLIDQVKVDFIITYSVVKSRDEIESFLNKLDEASHGQILYIENKHQAQMGILYPESVKKVSSFPAALDVL
jgi:methanogenic corrinoid protein MtbC1